MYQLTLTFAAADLENFANTSSSLYVAKPPSTGNPTVAWVVFEPLEANVLTWVEQYGIYASETNLTNGMTIVQESTVPCPAILGDVYELLPGGYFSAPSPGTDPNGYQVQNNYNQPDSYMTIGLTQDASVNSLATGANPVSAANTPHGSMADMMPYASVVLWIGSTVPSSTVFTSVTSPQTAVSLLDNAPQTWGFEAASETFSEVVPAGVGA
jgi:hypothetical protein